MLGWAYRGIERWATASAGRMAWIADRIPLGYMRRSSEAKLVRTLRRVWDRSPAQRERWARAGVRRRDLNSSEVLTRIPFTTGADLAGRPADFFCVPEVELIHAMRTSGTRGTVKQAYLTADDLIRQVRMGGANLLRFRGVTRAAAAFNAEVPTWGAGMVARRSIEEAGFYGLLSPTRLDVREQIRLLAEHRIQLLMSQPGYVHRMTLEAPEELKALGLRYILLGGQAWTEEFRGAIESVSGARVLDLYGLTECASGVASECVERRGLHVGETAHWAEVVDPATGAPLAEGREGELVLTTLARRGMPLVRYRTGDFATLLPRAERCPCGLPMRRISRVRGRVDDMLIIGGDANIWPDEFDRALLSLPGVTDYQVVVEKDRALDVLNVAVECPENGPALREAVIRALLTIPYLKIPVEMTKIVAFGRIEAVPRGTLSAGRAKTARIVDRRPAELSGPGPSRPR